MVQLSYLYITGKNIAFFFNIYKNVQNQEKGAERDLFKKKKT